MTSPLLFKFSKTFCKLLFFSMVLTAGLALAQEITDAETKAYEELKASGDSAKKVDLAAKFFQAHPNTGLKEQVMYEYKVGMQDLYKDKNWNSIINLGEKFLDVVPGDKTAVEMMAAAYEATGNTRGFATLAEKLYAAKPNADLAQSIAYSYLKLQNDAKFFQWGEKVLASDPDNVVIAGEMTSKYLRSQNFPQATKYARICLKALPTAKKPENVDAKQWKESTDSYYFYSHYAIGAAAYNANNFAQAIPNIENAVRYNKRFDTAYYCLGMSYWRVNKLQPAMLNFAKAIVLKGQTAASSKQNLEKLWKNSHQGKMTGIDVIYQRAQQDLK